MQQKYISYNACKSCCLDCLSPYLKNARVPRSELTYSGSGSLAVMILLKLEYSPGFGRGFRAGRGNRPLNFDLNEI